MPYKLVDWTVVVGVGDLISVVGGVECLESLVKPRSS